MRNLSVVIATLGGPSLKETLESLNSGTLVPKEILVCVPNGRETEISLPEFKNVKLLLAPEKGQVKQRIFGFTQATGDYVLQCDDDVVFESNCIEVLVKEMEGLTFPSALAPTFYIKSTKEYAYREPNIRDKVLGFLANGWTGYKPGTISRSGVSFGFSGIKNQQEAVSVEWLAGGCVLHKKENLILENYFPFSGKAYSEDLYHCMYLRRKGIKMYIVPEANAYFEWDESYLSIREEIHVLWKSFKVNLDYAKRDGRNRFFLFLHLIGVIGTYPLKYFIK